MQTLNQPTLICRTCQCPVPANEAILNVPIGGLNSGYRGDVCPSCWQNRSQVFVWEKHGKSIHWSVNLALAIIKAEGLKPHSLMTRKLAYDAMCKNDQVHELNLEHVMSANLDNPIIVVRHDEPGDEGSHIIIDGWHRIAKFVEHSDRQEPLPVYLLNEEQSQLIKIL
jgi:hypothetical protein